MYYNFNGFMVGLGIFLFGLLLDNTVSYESKKYLIKKDKKLLTKAYCYTGVNLLILNPIYYGIIVNHLISDINGGFNIIKYFLLLVIQSIGYYTIHISMHKNRTLRKFHKFHHKFTNVIIPSIGVSVTLVEYTIAYSFPFILGSFIVNPSLITLNLSIITVSLLNIFIHCSELSEIKYYKFLVSPNDHFNHHKNIPNINTYAAPFINIDNIIN